MICDKMVSKMYSKNIVGHNVFEVNGSLKRTNRQTGKVLEIPLTMNEKGVNPGYFLAEKIDNVSVDPTKIHNMFVDCYLV